MTDYTRLILNYETPLGVAFSNFSRVFIPIKIEEKGR